MKKHILILLAAASVFAASCCQCKSSVIAVETPAMPSGQQTMVGFAADAIDTVQIAIVGLGMRGSDAVRRYTYVPWVKIAAICDAEQDAVDKSLKYLEERGYSKPRTFVGDEAYKDLCAAEGIDLVYVCTDWAHHVPVALCAMENGKHTAVEVPSATTLKECWDLVNTSERTRKHCVILENCCYDFFELGTIEMARQGVFGEIVHAEGAYIHDLTPFWERYWKNWRLEANRTRKGDLYPTHGLGPVCQALNINRGDRFTTLVAMESPAINGPATVKRTMGEDAPDFQNADLTCTLLQTSKGKTVLIEHDVLTPRPYNRMYQLVGTEGYAAKYPVQQLYLNQSVLDSIGFAYDTKGKHSAFPKEVANGLLDKYRNPVLTADLEEKALEVGGHGGMDFIMDYRLIYCLHYGLPVDMDVYDLASWCCLAELGEISIKHGCAPVEVPDFTRGAWNTRPIFDYAFKAE